MLCLLLSFCLALLPLRVLAWNSTFDNPIIPGFHPDPSCVFVPELDNTFFCASSSFSVFPGIPIHASKDLVNWKLISNALNRPEQLPTLAVTNKSTSGIWASTIRYREGTFYLLTTLVFDDQPESNFSRWDNMIFTSSDPYTSAAWSQPVHFNFTGYDTSPFWDADGTVYVTGSHPWEVAPGITQTTLNLTTGEVGDTYQYVWNGTGGKAPEGPHIYSRDGYYYLMIAEGGTGLDHMETIARSRAVGGPYDANPANPLLTNANTTEYFQTVGHADLFQDAEGNWWGVALSTRSGPDFTVYPMGRETVLYPATWEPGEWPVLQPVRGQMDGWHLPATNLDIPGEGPFANEPDHLTFSPGSTLPIHLVHWRLPINTSYTVSPPGYPNKLRLLPSKLNLTGYDGNYAGPQGQTLLARRQMDTLFTYAVNLGFSPITEEEEAGVTVFLTQNHHIDLGVVLLSSTDAHTKSTELTPYLRFRSQSEIAVPPTTISPLPTAWLNRTLHMEIKAFNLTHYSFAAGPADAYSQMQTFGYGLAADVSYGFTGTLVGIYATGNGGEGTTPAYFSEWTYIGQGQYRD
ncbi:xylosidase : arab-like proteininofuranosidase [Fomitopsis betulina]|nr:xylosidase : arab-like proteininofuranosidase [Fomitopsis betulina]